MNPRARILRFLPIVSIALGFPGGARRAAGELAPEPPDAVIDLGTAAGAGLVRGEWRYRDARIVEVAHREPGPDLKPSGKPNRTHDIDPRADAAGFDDSGWEAIAPETLEARRSTGRLCFGWYRIQVTLPEKIGKVDAGGSTVYFEIVVDDYAEIWVDGKLPLVIGQAGGRLVKGWNSPNRVLLGRGVKPGQSFQIAVLAANAPLSNPPENFVWIRSAVIEVYRAGRLPIGREARCEVTRLDPALDAIVPAGARLEKLADEFLFTEGPAWAPEGHLLFSDPNANAIYRWSPEGEVSVFRSKSGYRGLDIGEYRQPGSNGLAFDREGRLTVCEHGNRRVARIERNGVVTVLADRYRGKRLNSPNDLCYRSDGALFFSDPPFGLPRFHEDPRRELSFSGVYSVIGGELKLASDELSGPNGLAFSPDERHLYVGNWDLDRKVVMRYRVAADGTFSSGQVFHDFADVLGEEAIDGIKVDRQGNVYVSGPGGLWILSPDGKRLGAIRGPELAANFAWGDEDGRTLYLTARTGLYRLRLGIPGARAFPTAP